MNPIAVAVRGKGTLNALNRVVVIGRRYGLTPDKMDRVLGHFAEILAQFGCNATFVVTGAALARNGGVVEKHQRQGIEFAVHGYYHVDHASLPLNQQLAHLARARRLFEDRGMACHGFRSPYLRWTEDTIAAVRQSGFLYDSSQSLAWPVVDGPLTDAYRQVLGFYGAASAAQYPALPRIENGLVEIPYCLPDDEAIIERLPCRDCDSVARPWQAILKETHRLGELFTLGLHPERIYLCEQPLMAVLFTASKLVPGVWVSRMDEMARWWRGRMETAINVHSSDSGEFLLAVRGPAGTTILARGVEVDSPTVPWADAYRQAIGSELRFRALRRPFIAVSPSSSPALVGFLCQQGYIVERAADGRNHTCFLNRPLFTREDERPLLAEIDKGGFPLVRLGRWPNGARSALCVTGDIDALTLWDYNLRFLGR